MKLYKKRLQFYLFSILLSLGVVLTPWEDIRNYIFNDLFINILKFNDINLYFETNYNLFSFKSFLSDEPLWYLINLFFYNIGFSGEFLFSMLAFFSIFIIANYVFNNIERLLYLLLLIHPVFLNFVLSQQRSALVFSIFLIFLNFKKIKYLIYLILPLIHSFSPFLILMAFFIDLFKNRSKLFINLLSLFFTFLLSFFLVYGRVFFANYTDDSRFQEYDSVVNSVLYTIPWVFYLLWIMVLSKRITLNYILLVIMLSMFLWLTFMDFYAVRFLAMSIPLIIANILNLRYYRYFVLIFLLHQILLMYLWINVDFKI